MRNNHHLFLPEVTQLIPDNRLRLSRDFYFDLSQDLLWLLQRFHPFPELRYLSLLTYLHFLELFSQDFLFFEPDLFFFCLLSAFESDFLLLFLELFSQDFLFLEHDLFFYRHLRFFELDLLLLRGLFSYFKHELGVSGDCPLQEFLAGEFLHCYFYSDDFSYSHTWQIWQGAVGLVGGGGGGGGKKHPSSLRTVLSDPKTRLAPPETALVFPTIAFVFPWTRLALPWTKLAFPKTPL